MGRPRIRTVKDAESGQHALLTAIWNHFGGPKAVADKCGLKDSDVLNWEMRGKVPLEYVAHVAEKLGLENFYEALNYIDVSLATRPSKRVQWKNMLTTVCMILEIPRNVHDQIFFLSPPKLPKLYKKV